MEPIAECEKAPAICPEGKRRATLTEIRDFQTNNGPTVRLIFSVCLEDGSQIGQQVSALASKCIYENSNSKLAKFAAALLGRELELGEKLYPNQIVGKECLVDVRHRAGANGKVFANVVDVLPLRQEEGEEGEVPF